MGNIKTTTTDGKGAPGELQAHVHPWPTPNSAVAIEEGADEAPGNAGSADSQRLSESDMGGSRKSYHQRRSRGHEDILICLR
eukprot:9416538-Pyramimonas_sp.AAC.1